MALQHLRSGTANKRPIPTAMSDGQLAVNTNLASPGLFFKDSNGDLVKAGPVHVGTTAPNASPASTAATALVANTVYQILTVGTSDFTAVGASANTVGVVFTATGTTTGTGTVSGQQGVEKGEQWLDTTNSLYVMKVYDGTGWRVTDSISLANGSAAAPSLHFGSDTNTGLFRSAADSLAITTAGTQRVVVGAAGGVGIGVVPPSYGTGRNSLDIHSSGATVTHLGLTNSTTGSNGASNGFNIIQNGLNTLLYLRESGFMSFSTANTERLRIDSSGRLLVGTTTEGFANVADNFTIADSGNCGMTIRSGSSNVGSIYFADAISGSGEYDGYIDYLHSSQAIRFGTNAGIERMRIDSSGNVGIGTAAPASKLDVKRTDAAGNYFYAGASSDNGIRGLQFSSSNNGVYLGAAHKIDATSSGGSIALATGGTERLRIDSSGRVGIGTTSPEEILHIAAASETVGSRDGVILQSTSSAAADTGLPLVFTADIGGGFTSYGLASIAGRKETGTVNGSDAAGYLQFATGSTGGSISEKMRIDSSGRVLVGTTTEGAAIADNLTVADSGHSGITIRSGTSSLGSLYFSDGTSGAAEYAGFVEYNHNGNYLGFGTGSTSRLRIDSAGNVGINTTSPGAKLHIESNAANAAKLRIAFDSTRYYDIFRASSDGTGFLNFYGSQSSYTGYVFGGVDGERMRIDSSGRVGIGTSSPTQPLTLHGNFKINTSNTDGNEQRALFNAGGSGDPFSITMYDADATTAGLTLSGNGSITAAGNIRTPRILAIGPSASDKVWSGYLTNTTGAATSFINADGSATFAGVGTFSGDLRVQDGGNFRVRTAADSASDAILLQNNGSITAFGDATINSLTVGRGKNSVASNTALGDHALFTNTTGSNNTAVGLNTLYYVTTGSNNTAVGNRSLQGTTGSNNTAVGASALFTNNVGSDNTAVGYYALLYNQSGNNNTAVGRYALAFNTTGSKNIGIGYTAGDGITTGSNNTIIGDIPGTSTLSDTVIIGAGTTERLRIDSSGNVGIGTTSPSDYTGGGYKTLTINGTTNGGVLDLKKANTHLGQVASTSSAVSLSSYDTVPLVFNTASNERMRIDSSGNVGIGTTSPSHQLTVHNASNTSGTIEANRFSVRNNYGNVSGLGNGFVSPASNTLAFATNSTERMRINSSGDVFVGRTSDSTSAAGISLLSSGKGTFNRDSSNALAVNRGSNDGNLVEFKRAGTTKGSISISGSTTSYNTSSDYRLKENVVDIADGITRVKQLQPRRFNFIADDTTTVDGFLAHEAQTVVPEAVTGEKDGEDMQGIDQSKLVPLLTAALQEAITKIETLEQRLSDAGIA